MKHPISDLSTAYRYLYPRLTVLVSSGTLQNPNALTIAWSCPLSVDPPLIGVLITKKRYSHEIIQRHNEFVINIPDSSQVKESYHIGRISGRVEPQKLKNAGFSVETSTMIKAPRIKECHINLECKLKDIIPTGDHDLFIGEVVFIAINHEITDNWAFDLKKFKPIYWRQSRSTEETYHLDLK
ncbi:MAG: flavin reductase family protein [Candidatus Heimdallarchaeota archaeon]|nr:MAG: flavin reductase family protein [Candidatus Heimdallarchaeota archaeon]